MRFGLGKTMIASLCILASLAMPQQTPLQEPLTWTMRTYQFVVLTTGPKSGSTPKEEQGKIQAEHLKYLESLWKSGKAVAVGPLADGGKWRGIIVFDAEKPEEVKPLVEADPWVKRGELGYKRYTWYCAKEVFGRAEKFMDMESFLIGVLRRPANAPTLPDDVRKKNQEGHMKNHERMFDMKMLFAAGPLSDGGDIRGLYILRNIKKEDAMKLTDPDPHFQAGSLKLELFTWMTAKGTIVSRFPK